MEYSNQHAGLRRTRRPDHNDPKWKETRSRIRNRDRWICQMCFCDVWSAPSEIDHIEPIAMGGDNAESNLQTLCTRCHALKTDEDIRRIKEDVLTAMGLPMDRSGFGSQILTTVHRKVG